MGFWQLASETRRAGAAPSVEMDTDLPGLDFQFLFVFFFNPTARSYIEGPDLK